MKTLSESAAASEDVQALKALYGMQGCRVGARQLVDVLFTVSTASLYNVQEDEGLAVCVVALRAIKSVFADVSPVLQLLFTIPMASVLQYMRPRFHPGLVHNYLLDWLVHLPSLREVYSRPISSDH